MLDYESALKEGYTESEIADYLASKGNFNISDARNEGYRDSEIIQHLNKPPASKGILDYGKQFLTNVGDFIAREKFGIGDTPPVKPEVMPQEPIQQPIQEPTMALPPIQREQGISTLGVPKVDTTGWGIASEGRKPLTEDILSKGLQTFMTPPFPVGEKPAESLGEWYQKLEKGIGNIITLPVQLPAQVAYGALGKPLQEGLEAGEGIGGLAKRVGKGALETVKEFGDFLLTPLGFKKYQEWAEKGFSATDAPELKDFFEQSKKDLLVDPVFWALPFLPVFKKMGLAKKGMEKLTRQMIDEYNLPKNISINPVDLRAELQTGGILPKEQFEIYKELGLKGSQIREALKKGITIEVPMEKITTIQDRPWFAKIKDMLQLKESEKHVSITRAGTPRQVSGRIGYEPLEPTVPVQPIVTAPITPESVKAKIAGLQAQGLPNTEILKTLTQEEKDVTFKPPITEPTLPVTPEPPRPIELESVYQGIRANEGIEAEKLIRNLNKMGVTTVDTHVRGDKVIVQISADDAMLDRIAGTGAILEKRQLPANVTDITETYNLKIPKDQVDRVIKEISEVKPTEPTLPEKPIVTPIPTAPEVKESWQMTKEEAIQSAEQEVKRIKDEWFVVKKQRIAIKPGDPSYQLLSRTRRGEDIGFKQRIVDAEKFVKDTAPAYHKINVQQALSEGRPVPEEVLKAYPELAKKPPEVSPIPVTEGKKEIEGTREAISHEVDWSSKKVVKDPIAGGTHYKVFTNWSDGDKSFYGWLKRDEIKKLEGNVIEIGEKKKTLVDLRKEKYLKGKTEGLDKFIADGWTPVTKDVKDTATTKKLESELATLQKTAPIGNPKHPDIIRMNEVKKQLAEGIYKESYRLEKGDTIKDITKIEYDYLKGKEVTPIEPITKEGEPVTVTETKETLKEAGTKTVSPKEQKQYLMSEIDKAIENAVDLDYEATKKLADPFSLGRIKIEIPGDGIFEVINTKGTLEHFKKLVKSNFPEKEEYRTKVPYGKAKPTLTEKERIEQLGRDIKEAEIKAKQEVLPEGKQPWEMTREEIKNWDFPVPEGGASKTPKTVFSWKREDYETLHDLAIQGDDFRFKDALGKGWSDWKTSLHLSDKIKRNEPITIYRASEEGKIIPGSYVSESLEYVKGHQEGILKGKGQIEKIVVKPSELMTYGDPHEFIYIPESVEKYHKDVIQQTLSEGKPVPPEVLKDYPDLVKEAKPTEPTPETRLTELRNQLADYESRKKAFAPDKGLGIDNISNYNRLIQDTKNEIAKIEKEKGITLGFMGYDVFVKELETLKGKVSEAMLPLIEIGINVYGEGKKTYTDFRGRMKEVLGNDLWASFNRTMLKVYHKAKEAFKNLLKAPPEEKPIVSKKGEKVAVGIEKESELTKTEVKPTIVKMEGKDLSLAEFPLGTLHVADRHPELAPFIKGNIKANQNTSDWILRHSEKIADAFDKVDKPSLYMKAFGRKGTKIRDVDLMINGKQETPPELSGFVDGVRGVLNDVKGEIIYKMKVDFSKSLSDKQREYLDWVEGGRIGDEPRIIIPKHTYVNKQDKTITVKEHSRPLMEATKKAVEEAQTEFAKMDKWGLTDYFPTIYRGQYKYLNENGGIIASGTTAKLAKADFEEKLASHPEWKDKTFIFVNDFTDLMTARASLNSDIINPLEYLGTRLSKKEFFRLISRTEKLIKSELSEAGVENVSGVNVNMSGIASFQKGTKFSGHLLRKRTSMRGEETDPFRALMSYIFSIGRKLGLEDAKKASYAFSDSLPTNMPNAKKYIKMQADNMAGRYNIIDELVDDIIGKRLGAKPFLATRFTSKGMRLETKLKLGYAPAKTAINRIGGVLHIALIEGIGNYRQGRKLLNAKDSDLINRIAKEGHLAGMEQLFGTEGQLLGQLAEGISRWRPMGSYQKAEVKNRSEALAAGYVAGLKKFNGDKDAAWIYALDSAALTQGLYDTASKPVIVRGPVIGASYQFKQYLTNEIRFMSKLTPKQWAGYIAGITAVAGTRGALLTIKSIIGISLIGIGIDELAERLNKKAPHWHRGIFGLVGIDVSAPATWQLPTRLRDWFGTLHNDLYATGKMVIQGMQNNGWTDEQINGYVRQIAPVGYNLYKGLQMLSDATIREGSKVIYKGTKGEGVFNFFGAKTVSQSRASDSARYMNQETRRLNEEIAVIEDKLFNSKTQEEIDKYYGELIEKKNIQTPDELTDMNNGLMRSLKSRQMTQELRNFIVLPKVLKLKEIEQRKRE